jgi:hypothetical protein
MSKSLLPKPKKSSANANEDIEIVKKPFHSDDEQQVLQKPLKKKSSKDKDIPIVAEVVDSEENDVNNIASDEDILPKPKKQSTKKKTDSKKVAEVAEATEEAEAVIDIVISKDVVDNTPKESKKKPSKQPVTKVAAPVVKVDSDVEDEVDSNVEDEDATDEVATDEVATDEVKRSDTELLNDYLLSIPKMSKLLVQKLTLLSKEQNKQLKSASKDAEKLEKIKGSIDSLEFISTTISSHSNNSVKFVKVLKDLSKKGGSKKKSSTHSSVPKNVTLKPCKTSEFNQFVEDNLSIVGKKGPIFREVPLKNEDGRYLISSTQVLGLLCAYIHDNNLSGQYPNKIKFKIDDRLSEIFSEYITKNPGKDFVYTSIMGIIPYLC